MVTCIKDLCVFVPQQWQRLLFRNRICFDTNHYLIGIGKDCSRTSTSACIDATNRKSCLKSSESRSSEQSKGLIHGSNCAWCPSGPCLAEGKHRCEAESVLETSNVHIYETCYEGMNIDCVCLDNTFKYSYLDIFTKSFVSILSCRFYQSCIQRIRRRKR